VERAGICLNCRDLLERTVQRAVQTSVQHSVCTQRSVTRRRAQRAGKNLRQIFTRFLTQKSRRKMTHFPVAPSF
jgi:hypothetical protein